MQIQIPAPNVDNDCDGRPCGSDIGEVLLGTDANIGAAWNRGLRERGNHVWKRISFETRFSEWKGLLGSEESADSFQNS